MPQLSIVRSEPLPREAASPSSGDRPRGLLEPGNVDLAAQPTVRNPDGSTSTVHSASYQLDGREVLLPSVTPDGRHLQTDEDILAEYQRTGRHLGIFDSPPSATAYAQQLHRDYEAGRYRRGASPASSDGLTIVRAEPMPAAPADRGGRVSPLTGAATVLATAPAMLAGVHAATKAVAPLATKVVGGKYTPAVVAGTVATQAARGEFGDAATTAGTAAAASQIPKGLAILDRATAPFRSVAQPATEAARVLLTDARGNILPPVARAAAARTPGILARGASAVSRVSGPLALLSTLYDLGRGAVDLARRDRALPPDQREALERDLLANTHTMFP